MRVSIDGTYVRADVADGMTRHYVVAGRIEKGSSLGTRFAWVAQHPLDAAGHLRAALEDNEWRPGVRVTTLADGADGLPGFVSSVSGDRSHTALDWFHISMCLRPIEQMGPGIADLFGVVAPATAQLLRAQLPRVRHQMWNGHWHAAMDRMRDIYRATRPAGEALPTAATDRIERFRRLLFELGQYLKNNWASLTDYGRAYRDGFRISSAVAESGMKHVINQRMGKRQPMRWSADGAHLLLQVRCADLDNRLEDLFRECYPAFRRKPAAAASPPP